MDQYTNIHYTNGVSLAYDFHIPEHSAGVKELLSVLIIYTSDSLIEI